MSQTHQRPFAESEGGADAMHSAIDQWLDKLVQLTDEARTSEQFQAWLAVQSRFHLNYEAEAHGFSRGRKPTTADEPTDDSAPTPTCL